MQHHLWRPVLLSHCQFRCCYGAPLQRSLHSIIHVSAMSILEALLGGAAVMYRSPDKIECRPLLKCEQGAGVWGCSVFSEWYGLRELACGCLDFIEGWMSQLGKITCRRAVWHYLAHCDLLPSLSALWRNVRYSYSAFLNYIRMCSNSCGLDRQENQTYVLGFFRAESNGAYLN